MLRHGRGCLSTEQRDNAVIGLEPKNWITLVDSRQMACWCYPACLRVWLRKPRVLVLHISEDRWQGVCRAYPIASHAVSINSLVPGTSDPVEPAPVGVTAIEYTFTVEYMFTKTWTYSVIHHRIVSTKGFVTLTATAPSSSFKTAIGSQLWFRFVLGLLQC